jgi:DAACS family dicarboxylate/amino acid:cation (Na+ or H+) symporter
VIEPFGRIFLRLIFMVVLPLIMSALVLGVAGLGDVGRLGRIGAKTLAYTVFATGLSVALGLALVNFFEPGSGLSEETRAALSATAARSPTVTPADAPVGLQAVVAIIPDNPLRAAVMFFSLMMGLGLALAPRETVAPFVAVLEGLYAIVMEVIELAMRLAPYGVAALLFTLTARLGAGVLRQLASYVLVVLAGLAIHQFITYALIVRFLARISPRLFFQRIRTVMLTAFSTSSSNATLPLSLTVTERSLGVPREIATFVLTLGSTANQNGTALFEGVTSSTVSTSVCRRSSWSC